MSTRVADHAAAVLAAAGVRHAFGMPGGEVVTMVDALEKAGIRFMLTRDETAAAIMAAATATYTGAPGLMVTTLGPGLANGVNGIADTSQEHLPLIVLSGAVAPDIRGRYTHQVIDHKAMLAPLVKQSFELTAEDPAGTMTSAIQLAMAPQPGPVHLDLAPETAALDIGPPADINDPRAGVVIPSNTASHEALKAKLAAAKRPLVIAGYDAVRADATATLIQFCEHLGAPVLTTYKAKGVVPESHPLSLGACGLSPKADAILLPLVKAADVVVLAGYDPIEMRQGWMAPFAETATVIDICPATPPHGMHTATDTIQADVSSGLTALLPDAGTAKRSDTWPDGAPKTARAKLKATFAPRGGWGPHAVFDTLQKTMPLDAILTADAGAHRILLTQMIEIDRPNQMLQSSSFSTMACALPLAAGAKTVFPDRPVIAVLGDGGLEMGLGELASLRDLDLPITLVVLQDQSLALIELKQKNAGLAKAGVTLGATKFEDIAPAFGGHGVRVKEAGHLAAALAAAYRRPTFTLIVCEISASDYDDTF